MMHLNFGDSCHISGISEASVVRFCMQLGYINSSLGCQATPKRGVVRIT